MWLTQDQIIWRLYAAAKLDTTNWVTLSGGNPCIHDLTHLCRILKAANWKIAVETQGTIYHPWIRFCDVVTVSPKAPGMGEIFEPDKFRPFIEQMVLHKGLNIKIVVFDRKDLDFARYIFKECMAHSMDPSQFYLSQGNPIPPQKQTPHYVMEGHINLLKGSYLQLFDWIKEDLVLSQVKFLPQWHVWLWGNKQGV
jgi:7-carboxy-7-deazaguanine synthase